jgi:hypothetical protein
MVGVRGLWTPANASNNLRKETEEHRLRLVSYFLSIRKV